MQFKDSKKSGMITVELAFGIISVMVILFIIMGSLNETMGKIFINSNFTRIASENTQRTDYTSYGRDYADSKVYVK